MAQECDWGYVVAVVRGLRRRCVEGRGVVRDAVTGRARANGGWQGQGRGVGSELVLELDVGSGALVRMVRAAL